MANRALQQKELKLKRQKRLFPKRYSAEYISVGSRFNSELASVSRGSVSGKAFDEEFNRYVDAKTGNRRPVSSRRLEAQKTALTMAEAEAEICPMFFNVVDNIYIQTRIYFNGSKTCFFVVHKDKKKNVEQRSITYSSKEVVMHKLVQSKITWVVNNSS